MNNIDQLIRQIKQQYNQLRQCNDPPIKKTIIWSIRPRCIEAINQINQQMLNSSYVAKRKHIQSIKDKVDEIQRKIDEEEVLAPKIGHGGRKIFYQEEQAIQVNGASRIIKTIVMQEIQTCNLKLNQKQINEMLKKMENNVEVNMQVNQMIIKQGYDLDKVQKNIEETYKNMAETNQELDEAKKQQIYHVQKVRGFFGKSLHGVWSFVFKPFKYVFHDAWKSKPIQKQSQK